MQDSSKLWVLALPEFSPGDFGCTESSLGRRQQLPGRSLLAEAAQRGSLLRLELGDELG